MKRAPAAMASTAAGLVAVLALHAASPSAPLAAGAPPASSPGRSTPSSSPSTTPSSSPSSTPSTQPGAVASAVGTSEQYGYGVISVKVTVKGQHIQAVTVANLQTAESYSQSLAQQAIPILQSEVLAAQSAHVNGVSGATYTSEGYLASLQSALDNLHVS